MDDYTKAVAQTLIDIANGIESFAYVANPQTQFAQRTQTDDVEAKISVGNRKTPVTLTLEANESPIRALKGGKLQRGKAMARRYLDLLKNQRVEDYREEACKLAAFATYKVMTGRARSLEGAMLSREILGRLENQADVKVESLTYGDTEWPRESILNKRESLEGYLEAMESANLIEAKQNRRESSMGDFKL